MYLAGSGWAGGFDGGGGVLDSMMDVCICGIFRNPELGC